MNSFISFFSILFFLSPFLAESETHRPADFVMCKSLKVVRTIRVEQKEGAQACRTLYTKAGIDREVGNGRNLSSCQRILKNIQSNLEGAKWNCKTPRSAFISVLSEEALD